MLFMLEDSRLSALCMSSHAYNSLRALNVSDGVKNTRLKVLVITRSYIRAAFHPTTDVMIKNQDA